MVGYVIIEMRELKMQRSCAIKINEFIKRIVSIIICIAYSETISSNYKIQRIPRKINTYIYT